MRHRCPLLLPILLGCVLGVRGEALVCSGATGCCEPGLVDGTGHADLSTYTSIPKEAFRDCASIKSVTFSARLESIGDNAFRNAPLAGVLDMSSLDRLTSVGSGAFQNCDLLTSVIFAARLLGSIGKWAFADSDSLTSVTFLGSSVSTDNIPAGYTPYRRLVEPDTVASPNLATASPTISPTASPTTSPTTSPGTASPTISPTASPTTSPTVSPTTSPTVSPTAEITMTVSPAVWQAVTDSSKKKKELEARVSKTIEQQLKDGGADENIECDCLISGPTSPGTSSPTTSPTSSPTTSPTSSPTTSPTSSPTTSPTSSPTTSPTSSPTTSPTSSPARRTLKARSVEPVILSCQITLVNEADATIVGQVASTEGFEDAVEAKINEVAGTTGSVIVGPISCSGPISCGGGGGGDDDSDDDGNDDNDDNGNDDNGNDDNDDNGNDDNDDNDDDGTTDLTTEAPTTDMAITMGDQLEGTERLTAERGQELNKDDAAILAYLKQSGDGSRGSSEQSFAVQAGPLEVENKPGGARALMVALLGPLGLMLMIGLLLFVARRSSRSRAATSPTAPAEVKPRVMKSDDTYAVVVD